MASTYPFPPDLLETAVDDQKSPDIICAWTISRGSSRTLTDLITSDVYDLVNYAMLGDNYGLKSSKWLNLGDDTAKLFE